MSLTVTKIFEFCYGHKLPEYEGKCRRFHGHNAILEVEVKHLPSLECYPGMVCDFSTLKKVVKERIEVLDHRNINDLPLVERLPNLQLSPSGEAWNKMIKHPTAENMVCWFVSVLEMQFSDSLVRVRLYETPSSYAEWRRNESN